MTDPDEDKISTAGGTQTLVRGLDLIELLTETPLHLADLCARLGINRSTVHRLATALVERGYLRLERRHGYSLGPKLLELGHAARNQIDLARIAHPLLEALSDATDDTVHLGVLDGDQALYLDKVPGKRRIEISSRVGERHPLCTTGLGKALLLDENPASWHGRYHAKPRPQNSRADEYELWFTRMQAYVVAGCAFDLEENEDRVRCVAAPIRDATGRIIAAISVSSAAQYMEDARMPALRDRVRETAAEISHALGATTRVRPPRRGIAGD